MRALAIAVLRPSSGERVGPADSRVYMESALRRSLRVFSDATRGTPVRVDHYRGEVRYRPALSVEALALRLENIAPSAIELGGGVRLHLAVILVSRQYVPIGERAFPDARETIAFGVADLLAGLIRYPIDSDDDGGGDPRRGSKRCAHVGRPHRGGVRRCRLVRGHDGRHEYGRSDDA